MSIKPPVPNFDQLLADLPEQCRQAVVFYWRTRSKQSRNQSERGAADRGSRSAVTGGAQMNGFLEMVADYLVKIGISKDEIFLNSKLELPGYFRPNKKWDLLVVRNGRLVAAIESKSQVGSFGNNFNNRTEEAMGSALDLWTAFREGAFSIETPPWLGYIFLLQDCAKSQTPVRATEPHFPVFPEFQEASYARRYEIFCRKLKLERHYQATAFLLAKDSTGKQGIFTEPASDLTLSLFMRSLLSHTVAHV